MVDGIDKQHQVSHAYAADRVQQIQQRKSDLQQRHFSVQLSEERNHPKKKANKLQEDEIVELAEREESDEHEKRGMNHRSREKPKKEKHAIDVKA